MSFWGYAEEASDEFGMMDRGSIAIVGAGLIGASWVLVFARAGFRVQVFDPSNETRAGLLSWMNVRLAELQKVAKGIVADPEAIISRVEVFSDLGRALEGASYVQESVLETVDLKKSVCHEIDALIGPKTIVGSSSSGIPSSSFTEDCANRAHFMAVHPVNPPHLIPVVEIVPATWTSPDCITNVAKLMRDVGQVPVLLKKEIDGFVLNRLQGVLLNEAWALYEDGIASIEDIDATIAHGLGLRWSFMGPFETIDLNAPGGIQDYAERLRGLYAGMTRLPPRGPWPDAVVAKATQERRKALPESEISNHSAWRDSVLARLGEFKRAATGSS